MTRTNQTTRKTENSPDRPDHAQNREWPGQTRPLAKQKTARVNQISDIHWTRLANTRARVRSAHLVQHVVNQAKQPPAHEVCLLDLP